MVDRYETKAFVRLHGRHLKSKLNKLYASAQDAKVARTFTDDANLSHDTGRRWYRRTRPGQRDDDNSNSCSIDAVLRV